MYILCSAGISEEKQGTFEEVLSLQNEQNPPPTSSAPIKAFDETAAAQTEGGDAALSANTSPTIVTAHDQVAGRAFCCFIVFQSYPLTASSSLLVAIIITS